MEALLNTLAGLGTQKLLVYAGLILPVSICFIWLFETIFFQNKGGLKMNNTPTNTNNFGGGMFPNYGVPQGHGFFTRWGLRNRKEASALRAEIASNDRKQAEEMIETTIAWGTAQDQFDQKRELIRANVDHVKAIVEKAQGESQNQLLKNQSIAFDNQKLKHSIDQMLLETKNIRQNGE